MDSSDGSTPARHPSVLLVEDEPAVRTVLAQALKDAGLTVAEAPGLHDAEQLLSAAAACRFDLVITDLGLQDGDGGAIIDTASILGLPCIGITGYPDRLPHGMVVGGPGAMLEKPFTLERFLHEVQMALKWKRGGKET
ncbi:MAG: response regulator [Proteobacteria bacterium]|nr:response regulator [Pseudomonadota bacterium]